MKHADTVQTFLDPEPELRSGYLRRRQGRHRHRWCDCHRDAGPGELCGYCRLHGGQTVDGLPTDQVRRRP